jgi:hypothetical protein
VAPPVPLEEHDNSPAEAAERLWHDLGGWGAPDRCDPIATRGASIQCSGLKAAVTGAYCAAQQGTVPGCFLGRFLPKLGEAASPAALFSRRAIESGPEIIRGCLCLSSARRRKVSAVASTTSGPAPRTHRDVEEAPLAKIHQVFCAGK